MVNAVAASLCKSVCQVKMCVWIKNKHYTLRIIRESSWITFLRSLRAKLKKSQRGNVNRLIFCNNHWEVSLNKLASKTFFEITLWIFLQCVISWIELTHKHKCMWWLAIKTCGNRAILYIHKNSWLGKLYSTSYLDFMYIRIHLMFRAHFLKIMSEFWCAFLTLNNLCYLHAILRGLSEKFVKKYF